MLKLAPLAFALLGLTGCDQIGQRLGLDDAARKSAEAQAVGSACRHSGRSIEDCYAIYGWLPKAGIFAGWREMDAYMRENSIQTVAPQLPPPESPGAARRRRQEAAEAPPAENEAKKEGEGSTKPAEKTAGKN